MELEHNIFKDVMNDQGRIYLDDERMILTSTKVFGTLRKDLMHYISEDHMKGFLIRYGWNLGKDDAKKLLRQNADSMEDLLKQGPTLHMMKGYTNVKRTKFQMETHLDGTIKSIHVEGKWIDSFEAEDHMNHFGHSSYPVCYTLVGYASGYYSEICQQPIIFKEVACKATGASDCYYVGKSLREWDGEIEDEIKYYDNPTILNELENTYKQLLEERNNLSKSVSIHNRLTDELINGNNLQSITDIVFQETQLPIIIKDINLSALSYSGLSEDSLEQFETQLRDCLEHNRQQNKHFYKTIHLKNKPYHYLTTPIMLKKKCLGYCTFIYRHDETPSKVEKMILENVATVCSLYLLNEKTSFETMERIKGHLLDQLINGDISSNEEIFKRGNYLNVNLNNAYYILALNYHSLPDDREAELMVYEELREYIRNYFKKRSNVLIGERSGVIVLLIPVEEKEDNIGSLSTNLLNNLENSFEKITFKLGVSTCAERIEEANEYYQEAITALQMTNTSKKIVLFQDLGVVGFLINSSNRKAIKQKAKHLLGELYTNKQEHAELVKTLYVFLSNGGNLEKSMEDLALSMSGLRYRIKRLESILKQELRDPSVSYQLLLTLQVLMVDGELSIEE
ncbi:XylR N-terminal domain-containing protein [Aquibacillus sediminis]|uniref:XylR N-terminal domain-containing protein n=1 Tax=Aquibacillus sediminis TaxID=2574734 RepID=UPI001107FEDD|nr:XylR N-terminal domain-containing protein [Aquibacillus sediminis]